ncbi:MAG: hypothetical protein HY268_14680 [Deltaproteobacteria bacterium]|nr:hypothetical protein [Deltaproteobacteria bacterium]
MSPQVIRLSKIEVAERQLREAIRLFAEGRDPVVVRTVAGTAHQVLNDLTKTRGFGSFIKDSPYLRPEKKREWIEMVNSAQNFFKHADRDPEAVLDFYPEFTKFLLLDAVEMYLTLRKCLFLEGFVFRAWLYVNYPQFFADQNLRGQFEDFARQLGTHVNDFGKALQTVESLVRSGHISLPGT